MLVSASRQRGFSLIEVLVTVLVISMGLLGLAKMQASAVSNTQVSRVRSLISLQASSLAAAMHANKGFWAAGLAPGSFSATGTTITDSSATLTQAADCVANTCTPAQLAAYDVQDWVANMNTQFPTYTASVTCTTTTGVPVNCTITVTWSEKYIAINKSTAASAPAMTSTQRFALHVEP